MSFESDVQKLEPGAIVELFELDTTAIGGAIYRFHSGINGIGISVYWQGVPYQPFPIDASGFEQTTAGALPTPKLVVANVTGLVGAMCNSMDDMLGATLIRRRTFVRYLDAVNFPGGVNLTADPNVHFPNEIWRINRKVNENKVLVEFELASAMDVQGVMLPRRQVIANICTWKYRSSECSYAGTNKYTILNVTTLDGSQDRCSKSLTGCKLRFGATAQLPFGGFPAAGRMS